MIVCNSFSKTWVMTGWRLGWLVVPDGARDAITELVEVTHSGVAPFIQHAGLAAVQDTDIVERFRGHCAIGRTLTGDALSGLNGVRHVAPDGAFYAFVGVEGLTDSLSLAKRLVVDHHVAVAPALRSARTARVFYASALPNQPNEWNAHWADCETGSERRHRWRGGWNLGCNSTRPFDHPISRRTLSRLTSRNPASRVKHSHREF